MASHAHSIPVPLARQTTGSAGLLPASLPGGRIVAAGGAVTRALAVMATADPDLARVRVLRRSIAERIEADIALLDALAGDSDLEENGDLEPSLCGCTSHVFGEMLMPGEGGDDREGDIADEPHDDDEREHDEAERGIADADGLGEQGGNPYAYGYDQGMPFVGGCGL